MHAYVTEYLAIAIYYILYLCKSETIRNHGQLLAGFRPEPIMLLKLPIVMLLSNAPNFSLLCPNYAPLCPIMLRSINYCYLSLKINLFL